MKYFLVVVLLWGVQILMGILTAHYGVEGERLLRLPAGQVSCPTRSPAPGICSSLSSGLPLPGWRPVSMSHRPSAAMNPKYQRLGVNVLFVALLLVVGGSMAGEWMGIQQSLGNMWFWFGSQGYEYVDLGRFWQILLFIGLVLWLLLMVGALKPALVRRAKTAAADPVPHLLHRHSALLCRGSDVRAAQQLVTAEYWRWWVVHLWVEGFFEVFATVVIAFLFTRLKLLEIRSATRAALFSTTIFLSGGIIGTFHHLYFAGSTPAVIGLGAIFSALEVVPLTLIGYEAWENTPAGARPTEKAAWIANYKWPIYFFVAVAFWNLVGAGIFGFLINPPIALYYMQGLNLTPLHGHTALFGVYGMLGLGLTLFCLRAMRPGRPWKEGPLKWSFWLLNIGLGNAWPCSACSRSAAAGHGLHPARHMVRAVGRVPADSARCKRCAGCASPVTYSSPRAASSWGCSFSVCSPDIRMQSRGAAES